MRLLEAIIDANHRATEGDGRAGLHLADYSDALPLAALTCIDARLNPLIPEVLGVPEDQFIWLRNAGNIITGPLSSTLRSLALACAVKGGREIVIIGHSDCLVCKSTVMQLTDRFRALGIDRAKLPENLNEYFGLFASERQNVLKAVEFVRGSPLIGPRIPVHGLMVDIQTGKLEWLVNGYRALELAATPAPGVKQDGGPSAVGAELGGALAAFHTGEMKFPDFKIGDMSAPGPVRPTTPVGPVMPSTEATRFDQPIGQPGPTPEIRMEPIPTTGFQAPVTPLAPIIAADPRVAELDWRQGIKANRLYKIIGSDKKQYGPIPGTKVLEWLADERIDGQTPVQEHGTTEWKPLSALGREKAGGGLPPLIAGDLPRRRR